MKANKIKNGKHTGLLVVLSLTLLAGLGLGIAFGYGKLRELYLEQCVITDMTAQVFISQGKMVKAGVIAENMGLKPGANLALIDFAAKRAELLGKVPNLRELTVTRQLPDKVTIVTEERSPIARMSVRGSREETGRVVDADGMVFLCRRGTQMLPAIRESSASPTAPGQLLKGRTRAALTLIDCARDPEFSDLNLLEVDVTCRDYLLATLGNYSKLKITWESMDDPTRDSRPDLLARLTHLVQAIRSQVGADARTWNATMPNRIFADTQEKP